MEIKILTRDRLKEAIACVNEMIVRRIEYSFSKDNNTRLRDNKKALQIDYELLEILLNYKKELEDLEEIG
jgi:hypothetical protein